MISDDRFTRAHPQLLFRPVRGETVIFELCCSRLCQKSWSDIHNETVFSLKLNADFFWLPSLRLTVENRLKVRLTVVTHIFKQIHKYIA